MITKHIVLEGKVNYEMVNKFLEAINAYYFDEFNKIQQPKFCIYLSSGGGMEEAEFVMVNAINSQPERFTLVANGEIQSAAFEMFFNCKCDKTVLPGTFGMYHLSSITVDISETGEGYCEGDRFHIKHFTERQKETGIWCERLGMTAEEIESVLTGKEAYFTANRLKEFIKNQIENEERTETINGSADKSTGESKSISGVVGSPEPAGECANSNGQTHDHNEPGSNDREPQNSNGE